MIVVRGLGVGWGRRRRVKLILLLIEGGWYGRWGVLGTRVLLFGK